MSYNRLIQQKLIRPYQADVKEIEQLIQVAVRDYETAEQNLDNAPDWAYNMAYNAVLQIGRALMFNEGYRPRGANQHATVVEFMREKLGNPYLKQINLVDQMRRKRHRVVYEVAGIVSKDEAKQVVQFAKDFVTEITGLIRS